MSAPVLRFGTSGAGVHVDLDKLIASRLLIQASSGGGKSRAIRQLLEETHGRVQHIVIDPEGEFASLREQFDYVLAAKTGGDVEANPRTAKLLCRKLMELKASAILDLYELKLHERQQFVKHFLNEMLALPRALWHPVLVVIDEAQQFMPERGSTESVSTEECIALAVTGRKRGFCMAAATSRISKVHKDAVAELLNKMVGRTGDVDVKRAGDELGFGKEQRGAIKLLTPGEFYVYGPAISNTVTKVMTGDESATADRQPPEEEPTVEIDALVVQAKTNWCSFSHGHGMDSKQIAAIDMLASLARKAHPAPVPVSWRENPAARALRDAIDLSENGRTVQADIDALCDAVAFCAVPVERGEETT